jgi:hypothetical protein
MHLGTGSQLTADEAFTIIWWGKLLDAGQRDELVRFSL